MSKSDDELQAAIHREVTAAANKQINAAYTGDVNPIDTWVNTQSIMQLIQARDEQTAKAYGGCTNCYGKGYSTYKGEYKARDMRWQDERMKFCDCERGKQLERLLEQREIDIRIEELERVGHWDDAICSDVWWAYDVKREERIAELEALKGKQDAR